MKAIILYILLFFFAIGCKTDIKQTAKTIENNTVKVDTVKIPKQIEQKSLKSLKEKLVGTIYRKAYEITEFKDLSSGGFSIGTYAFNGKEYSIKKITDDNSIKLLVFNEVVKRTDEGKAMFKIIDLLEISKETDVFKKYPNKPIDIISDVLQNGKKAPELFALAAYEEAEVMTEVYKVWRANRKTGKLEEIKDLSNITVINEDF